MKRLLLCPIVAMLMLAGEPAVGAVWPEPREEAGFLEAACVVTMTRMEPWQVGCVEAIAYRLAPPSAGQQGATP